MTNNELLLEISNTMQRHLQPAHSKLDKIDIRLDSIEKRETALENRMMALEGRVAALENRVSALKNRVSTLEQRMNACESRLEKAASQLKSEALPLLHEASSYGMSTGMPTYKRSLDFAERIDVLEKNQQVLTRVVAGHSKELRRLS